jgi:hypothetical protein
MAEWTVVHKLWADDSTLDEIKPMDLDFQWSIGSIGPSTIDYAVSLAEPNMKWGYIGPYRTYWELWNHDIDHAIDAGPHVGYRSVKGSNRLQVMGKSWLHELELRGYPFNPANPNEFLGGTAANDQGIAYQSLKDIAFVIDDVFNLTFSRPNSRLPYGFYTAQPMGIVQGIQIPLGDTETMYDKVSAWSQISPGFEFEIVHDKAMYTYLFSKFPEQCRTDPNSCLHIFDKWIVPTDLVDAEFENDGPEMTHILAQGAGTATRVGRALSYDKSEQIFGRIDGFVDASDVIDQSHINDLAQHRLSKGLYPRHGLPMDARTDNIPDFWTRFEPGLAVWVRQDFENANVNSAWCMNTINLKLDREGEEKVSLIMEEVNEEGRPGVTNG